MADRIVSWKVVANFSAVAKEANKAKKALQELQAQQAAMNASSGGGSGAGQAAAASKQAAALNKVAEASGKANDETTKLSKSTKDQATALQSAAASAAKAKDETSKLTAEQAKLGAQAPAISKSEQALADLGKTATKLRLEEEKVAAAAKNTASALDGQSESTKKARVETEGLQKSFAGNGASSFGAAIGALAGRLRDHASGARSSSDETRRFSRELKDSEKATLSAARAAENLKRAQSGSGGGGGSFFSRMGDDANKGSKGIRGFGMALKLLVGIPAIASAIGVLASTLEPLAAGFTSLAGAIGPAAGALLALPQLALVGAGALGTLIAGFAGVGGALQAYGKQQKNAATQAAATAKAEQQRGRAMQSAARAQTAANERLTEAQRNVAKVEIQNARAIKDAQRGVRDAREAAAQSAVDGARQIDAAEQRVKDAIDNERSAQLAVIAARRQAKDGIDDLKRSLRDMALSEEGASISLEESRNRLAEVMADPGSTDLEKRSADLAVREAEARLSDVKKQHKDTAKAYEDAAKKGVAGADVVIAAQKQQADATRAVKEAQQDLGRTQADVARSARDSAEAVARAQQGVRDASAQAAESQRAAAKAVKDALQGVKDAHQAVGDAAAKATAPVDEFKAAMAKLTPESRAVVNQLLKMKPLLDQIRATAQKGLMPGVLSFLKDATKLFPAVNGYVGEAADKLSDLFTRVGNLMTSSSALEGWGALFDSNVKIMGVFNDAIINILTALGNIAVAGIPFTEWLVDTFKGWTDAWKAMTSGEAGQKRVQDFLENTKSALQLLGRIIGATVGIFYNLGKAGGDAGREMLGAIADTLEKWNEFLGSAEGQDALKDWFNEMIPLFKGLMGIIGDLVSGIVDIGRKVDLQPIIDQIRDNLIPAVLGFIEMFDGDFAGLLISIATNILTFFTAFEGQAGMLTTVLGLVDKFTGFLSWLVNNVPGASQALAVLVGAFGGLKILGGLLGVIGKLGPAFSFIATAASRLGPILMTVASVVGRAMLIIGRAMLANPWVLLVVALVAVVFLVIKYWDQIKAAVVSAALYIWGWLKKLGGWFSGIFTSILGFLSSVWGGIVDIFGPPLQAVWALVVKVFKAIWWAISLYMKIITTLLKIAWNLIKGLVIRPVVLMWQLVVAAFKAFYSWAMGWVATFLSWLGRKWAGIKALMLDPIVTAVRNVMSKLGDFFGSVKDVVGRILSWVKTNFFKVIDYIAKPFETAKRKVGEFLEAIRKTAEEWGEKLGKALSDLGTLVGKAFDAIKGAALKPVEFVVKTVLNGGIIKGYNWLADKIGGMDKVDEIPWDPPKLATGGQVPGYAGGGKLRGPGTGTSDSILGIDKRGIPTARVSAGEYVMPEKKTKKFFPVLEAMRSGKLDTEWSKPVAYATGGVVRDADGGAKVARTNGGHFSNPSGRTTLDGKAISRIAKAQIRLAEQVSGISMRVMQGGFGGSHVAASGTSHNYPGVADLSPGSIKQEKILRQVGFAAWARNVPGRSRVGSGAHNHAVSLLDPGDRNAPQVKYSWPGHGNGLSGRNNDPAPHYAWLPNLREKLGAVNLDAQGGGADGSGGSDGAAELIASAAKGIKDRIAGALAKLADGIPNTQAGNIIKGVAKKAGAGILKKATSLIGKIKSGVGDAKDFVVKGVKTMAAWRWAPLVMTALKMNKLPMHLTDNWVKQIQSESGGNPNAVQGNIGDVNNRSGDLAKGLVQVIGSTFQAYRSKSLPNNRFDPLANLYAGMNWAKNGRHWGPSEQEAQIGHGHGYARGTSGATPGWRLVGEQGPELVRFKGGEQVANNRKTTEALANLPRYNTGGPVRGMAPGASGEWVRAINSQLFRGYSPNWTGGLTAALAKTNGAIPSQVPSLKANTGIINKVVALLTGKKWKGKNFPDSLPWIAGQTKTDPTMLWRQGAFIAKALVQKKAPATTNNQFSKARTSFNSSRLGWIKALENKLSIKPADGIFGSELTLPVKHMVAHGLKWPVGTHGHGEWDPRPWNPPTAAENAVKGQEAANAQARQYQAYQQQLASWGLTSVVNKLIEMGPTDGMNLAKSLVANRTVATRYNKDLAEADKAAAGQEAYKQLLTLVATVAQGPNVGLQQVAAALSTSQDVAVQKYEQAQAQGLFKGVPAANLVRIISDIRRYKALFDFDAGRFDNPTVTTGRSVPKRRNGGPVPSPRRYRNGGDVPSSRVPGYGNGDRVHILAEPGEHVIRRNAVRALQRDGISMDDINHYDRMALGGQIGSSRLSSSPLSVVSTSSSTTSSGASKTVNNYIDVTNVNPAPEPGSMSVQKTFVKLARRGMFGQDDD